MTLVGQVWLQLLLAAATKLQCDRVIELGHGQLDKRRTAELTFKERDGRRNAQRSRRRKIKNFVDHYQLGSEGRYEEVSSEWTT